MPGVNNSVSNYNTQPTSSHNTTILDFGDSRVREGLKSVTDHFTPDIQHGPLNMTQSPAIANKLKLALGGNFLRDMVPATNDEGRYVSKKHAKEIVLKRHELLRQKNAAQRQAEEDRAMVGLLRKAQVKHGLTETPQKSIMLYKNLKESNHTFLHSVFKDNVDSEVKDGADRGNPAHAIAKFRPAIIAVNTADQKEEKEFIRKLAHEIKADRIKSNDVRRKEPPASNGNLVERNNLAEFEAEGECSVDQENIAGSGRPTTMEPMHEIPSKPNNNNWMNALARVNDDYEKSGAQAEAEEALLNTAINNVDWSKIPPSKTHSIDRIMKAIDPDLWKLKVEVHVRNQYMAKNDLLTDHHENKPYTSDVDNAINALDKEKAEGLLPTHAKELLHKVVGKYIDRLNRQKGAPAKWGDVPEDTPRRLSNLIKEGERKIKKPTFPMDR